MPVARHVPSHTAPLLPGSLGAGRHKAPDADSVGLARWQGGGCLNPLFLPCVQADFEKSYWKGILDAQGKTDGGYY